MVLLSNYLINYSIFSIIKMFEVEKASH